MLGFFCEVIAAAEIAKGLNGDYKFGCKPSAVRAEDFRDKITAIITS